MLFRDALSPHSILRGWGKVVSKAILARVMNCLLPQRFIKTVRGVFPPSPIDLFSAPKLPLAKPTTTLTSPQPFRKNSHMPQIRQKSGLTVTDRKQITENTWYRGKRRQNTDSGASRPHLRHLCSWASLPRVAEVLPQCSSSQRGDLTLAFS